MTGAQASEWLDDDTVEQEDFAVFPENVPALRVFIAMGTQWRAVAGMSGLIYTGLDYSALLEVWKHQGIDKKDRARVFDQLRIMELAALPVRNAGSR